MSKLQPELIQITTSDNLLLPGLFFEPNPQSKKALISLHGNGGSSTLRHQKLTHAFVEELTSQGISYLPFNNRGAGYYTKVDLAKAEGDETSRKYGMAYELMAETVADIDGAINFLRDRGYEDIYLLGFSTGANKICLYNFLKPNNSVRKYILACGGDDTGIYYNTWGSEKFYAYLEEAKMAVENGRGRDLILDLVKEGNLISYQSLLDTLDPDGNYNIFPYYEILNNKRLGKKKLLHEFSSIMKPTLVIYGDQDEHSYGKVPEILNILKEYQNAQTSIDYQMIEGGDHGFTGKENELAHQVAKFLIV